MGADGPIGEDAGMDRRVQGLHPSIEHLGDARDLGHLGVLDAAASRTLAVPPTGDQLDTEGPKSSCELLETGLVVNRQQSSHQ